MPRITHILVPLDWSESSKHALKVGASLAREHSAQLIVLHVVPVPVVMYGPAPESYENHLLDELRRIKPIDPKTPVQCLLAEGDPATAILRAARESNCDLIVMGTHGRKGLNRLLMGSVAEKVAAKAPCPVLTLNSNVSPERIGNPLAQVASENGS